MQHAQPDTQRRYQHEQEKIDTKDQRLDEEGAAEENTEQKGQA